MNQIVTLIFILLFPFFIYAQDPCEEIDLLTINDTTICEGQTLIISATSDLPNYTWNTGSLNEFISISIPGTYTVNTSYTTNNLVTNGNFSDGTEGFNSSYNYSSTNLVPEGVYTVTTNANYVHSGFTGTGNGNFMVVNGSTSPGIEVWCQNITVEPESSYNFSSDITTVAGGNLALLQFSINGEVIGNPFSAPTIIGSWNSFNSPWYSSTNTVAEICIVNQTVSGGGNDFGIDDITFTTLCEFSESLEVIEVEIADATIFPQDSLCETENSINLSAIDQGGIWTGPGIQNEQTGLFDPFIAGPGIHSITYTISGVCGDQDTQSVGVIPEISSYITAPTSICTNDPIIQLEGFPSIGSWSGSGITNSQNGFFDPAIATIGTNQINYSPTGFCISESEHQINVFDYEIPEVEQFHQICFGEEVNLEIESEINYDYLWSTGESNSNIYVLEAGDYSVEITDINNCKQNIYYTVFAKENCENIVMPNTFSPNGDYINDLFLPIEYEHVVASNIRIFNRWGYEVFFSNDIKLGWDGYHFSQECPEGVYFWIIDFKSNTGEYQSINGYLNLFR